jgi:uncharacterized protein YdhG (YjbR/CyaY superfamily)
MADRQPAKKDGRTPANTFTKEERAAVRERAKELRASASRAEAELEVTAKIAEMQPSDRVMAERLHALVRIHAPALSAKTWYGMPAYTKDDQVVCFFRPAKKFGTRYATLGFSDEAKLDDGPMWPTDFALLGLTRKEETRIIALLKRALT